MTLKTEVYKGKDPPTISALKRSIQYAREWRQSRKRKETESSVEKRIFQEIGWDRELWQQYKFGQRLSLHSVSISYGLNILNEGKADSCKGLLSMEDYANSLSHFKNGKTPWSDTQFRDWILEIFLERYWTNWLHDCSDTPLTLDSVNVPKTCSYINME